MCSTMYLNKKLIFITFFNQTFRILSQQGSLWLEVGSVIQGHEPEILRLSNQSDRRRPTLLGSDCKCSVTLTHSNVITSESKE